MHDKKEVTFGALSQESTCGLRFVSVPVSDGNDFCDYYILYNVWPPLYVVMYTRENITGYYKSKYKKVGVQPVRIVWSNVSLWRRANARNVRLYYPFWQYTNLFIFRFLSLLCLRSTLRLFHRLTVLTNDSIVQLCFDILNTAWRIDRGCSHMLEHAKTQLDTTTKFMVVVTSLYNLVIS